MAAGAAVPASFRKPRRFVPLVSSVMSILPDAGYLARLCVVLHSKAERLLFR
jgi:hypothetical protein